MKTLKLGGKIFTEVVTKKLERLERKTRQCYDLETRESKGIEKKWSIVAETVSHTGL